MSIYFYEVGGESGDHGDEGYLLYHETLFTEAQIKEFSLEALAEVARVSGDTDEMVIFMVDHDAFLEYFIKKGFKRIKREVNYPFEKGIYYEHLLWKEGRYFDSPKKEYNEI